MQFYICDETYIPSIHTSKIITLRPCDFNKLTHKPTKIIPAIILVTDTTGFLPNIYVF